ncbi:unnamed protein product [Brassica rapa]|uniref:Peptidase A1 domain-containing protein n=1 Tax=Brassica campestris TaxID=3711 RepID=A0A8D9LPA3_BRACM|nr:unnamed protein product [Brassica rapa]
MGMTLSIQIITSFLFAAPVSSSPPSGFTIDLFKRRLNSSSSRIYNTQLGSPYADTLFDTSVYLMKLQIGTPPVEIEAILDTGSEVIWTDCLPCHNCFKQSGPAFNPLDSSTYEEKICDGSPCQYEIDYTDQSYTRGTYATETVTIQSTSGYSYVMPKTTIGCSHNASVTFQTSASGIVGLNWGPWSLVSQMGDDMLGLMSYCFSGEGTSKLNFGGNAIVSGDGTISANMFKKEEDPNQYYLNLDAISVGKTRIETLGTPFHASNGNMIIDSGTTYTFLRKTYYNKVRKAVENIVKADQEDSGDNWLCYKTNNMDIFPVITMHFQGGADLVLDKYNTYMISGETICLMILCDSRTPVFVYKFCEDPITRTSSSQPDSRPTSPVSPYRYQRPLTSTTSHHSSNSHTLPASMSTTSTTPQPSDICHSSDLTRTALLRSVQMRTQPCGIASTSGTSNVDGGEERMRFKSMEEDMSYTEFSGKSKSCKALDIETM